MNRDSYNFLGSKLPQSAAAQGTILPSRPLLKDFIQGIPATPLEQIFQQGLLENIISALLSQNLRIVNVHSLTFTSIPKHSYLPPLAIGQYDKCILSQKLKNSQYIW